MNFGDKTVSASAAVADAYTQMGNRIDNEYLQFYTERGTSYLYTASGKSLLFPGTSRTVINVNGEPYTYEYDTSYVNDEGTSLYSTVRFWKRTDGANRCGEERFRAMVGPLAIRSSEMKSSVSPSRSRDLGSRSSSAWT